MGEVQATNHRPPQRYVLKGGKEERISGEAHGDIIDDLYKRVQEDLEEAVRRKDGRGKGPPCKSQLYFVRGPMGSGCSTLCDELGKRLGRAGGDETIIGGVRGGGRSQSQMYELIDADLNGTVADYAKQIADTRTRMDVVIVFGREDFLRQTGLFPTADRFFDLVPIDPGSGAVTEWIAYFGQEMGASSPGFTREKALRAKRLYGQVAQRREYRWVKWLRLVVEYVRHEGVVANAEASPSPLQTFVIALERLETPDKQLTKLRKRLSDTKLANPSRSHPYADVQLMRANLVLENPRWFDDLTKLPDPGEAVDLLCGHLAWRAKEEGTISGVEEQLLSGFMALLGVDMLNDKVSCDYAGGHGLWLQGMAAGCLLTVAKACGNSPSTHAWKQRANEFADRLESFIDEGGAIKMPPAQLWDLTDTLHLIDPVGLGRLKRSLKVHSKNVYFRHYAASDIEVGSSVKEQPCAEQKPLPPYNRTTVPLAGPKGAVWIAKYLVTVGEFREFHEHCLNTESAREYFEGPGRDWFDEDARLLQLIDRDFEVTKERTLACERQLSRREREALRDYEERIRDRALRGQPRTAQPGHERPKRAWETDPHHMGHALPVVDVNWWEANAYCKWFTKCKLSHSEWGPGQYEARLMPDWLWEAVRRDAFRETCAGDGPVPLERPDEFPGHIPMGATERPQPGRVGHLCFPVHVGLFPPPNSGVGQGPYDLAGNVWEWTASASFARVGRKGLLHRLSSAFRRMVLGVKDQDRYSTYWEHPAEEYEARHDRRESAKGRLQRRILRGGSFMSDPPLYAWGACMRTCDPPYYSFQDVGFRIAVFPVHDARVIGAAQASKEVARDSQP